MSARATRRVLIILSVAVAATTVIAVVTLIREDTLDRKIGGVTIVGPCRDLGPDHPECIRQANLIAVACVRHPREPACKRLREVITGSEKPGRSSDRRTGSNAEQGGGGSAGAPAPSQPGPPSGGSSGGNTPPPNPPARPPGLLDPVTEPVCRNLRVCL